MNYKILLTIILFTGFSSTFAQTESVTIDHQKTKSWKTLFILSFAPSDANTSIIKKAGTKIFNLTKSINFMDLTSATSSENKLIPSDPRDFQNKFSGMGYERVVIVNIFETKKKSATQLGGGADKYLLHLNDGEYRITAEIICIDTGERKKISDKFSGELYNPSKNIFKDSFSEFFPERNEIKIVSEMKEPPAPKQEPVIRSIYLSSGLALNFPCGQYRNYSNTGFGFHFETGAENYYFPEFHVNLSIDLLKMIPKSGKISPYYLFPLLLKGGYQFDLNQELSITPFFGAGVLIHSISKSYYCDPLFSVGALTSYHIDKISALFIEGSFYQYYDSYNKGSGIELTAGYTRFFNFSITQDESYNIINLD
jgi:hypothetical protein